jgi:hypothetical protein
MSAFSNDFGGNYIRNYADDFKAKADEIRSKYLNDYLIHSATSKAKADDSQGGSISLGDTFKDPTTGELTKEVTFTQKRDTKPETPAPNDKILGMNKYVVIGGALAVVILGGFLVYELTKTNK